MKHYVFVDILMVRTQIRLTKQILTPIYSGGVLRDRRLRDSSRAIRSNTRSIYISGITGQGITGHLESNKMTQKSKFPVHFNEVLIKHDFFKNLNVSNWSFEVS